MRAILTVAGLTIVCILAGWATGVLAAQFTHGDLFDVLGTDDEC